MEKAKYNEQGICPFCGSVVEYTDNDLSSISFIAYWTCPSCGTTGEEVYSFVGQFNCNKDGNEIDCIEDILENK